MILRAIFFLAIAALLIPHEPDLGLGRPGALSTLAAMPQGLLSGDLSKQACDGRRAACATVLAAADDFQGFALTRLRAVKAEIAADQRRRADAVD